MSLQLQDKHYIVYKHTAPNGKVYIGITGQNPLKRWASGFGYETQIYFWRAIVKYGWINIKHEILYENLSEQEAKDIEIRLIKEYNSQDVNCGYNVDLGYDHLQSKETRQKMAEAKKGKKWSERQRLAYLEYADHYHGRSVYKYDIEGNLIETFISVTKAARDANLPVETLRTRLKNNRRNNNFKFHYSYGKFEDMGVAYENGGYVKASVDMYDISMNYIRTFSSIQEALDFLGHKGFGHISDVCKGKRLSFKGYIWRYHNENTDNKVA